MSNTSVTIPSPRAESAPRTRQYLTLRRGLGSALVALTVAMAAVPATRTAVHASTCDQGVRTCIFFNERGGASVGEHIYTLTRGTDSTPGIDDGYASDYIGGYGTSDVNGTASEESGVGGDLSPQLPPKPTCTSNCNQVTP